MPSNSNRSQRNNPYLIEGLAVDFHRSPAGIAWRWRTELTLLAATLAGYLRLAATITAIWAAITLAGLLTVGPGRPALPPVPDKRAWCVISRHRLQRVFYETRMHTRAGRLPLILWIRPTKVGERAWILCRAGVCADDFDAYKAEIGAACYAREARVIRNKKWSHFVTLDVIRHDPLTAQVIIPSRSRSSPTAPPGGRPPARARKEPRAGMTTTHDAMRQPVVKLTTQLTRGDHIHIDGLGGFAVTHAQPFGSNALIRLAWENLAIITARDTRWQAITPAERIYLHGYQPCGQCDGKGIVFATHDQPEPVWDGRTQRWVTP